MTQEVSATAKIKDAESGEVKEEITETVQYDFGENVLDAVDKFGEEVVFTNFKQSAVIALQSRMRSLVVGSKDTPGVRGKALQKAVSEWKPGVKTITRKSPAEKIKGLLEGKSPEEIAELLKQAGIA